MKPKTEPAITPAEAHALVHGATTPEGERALRTEAMRLARGMLREGQENEVNRAKLATLARLVAEGNAEAETMAADVLRGTDTDMRIESVHIENGRCRTVLRAWPAYMLAESSCAMLDGDMAVNYVEMQVTGLGAGKRSVLLTVQRLERPSPHDLRRDAEERVGRLRARLAEAGVDAGE